MKIIASMTCRIQPDRSFCEIQQWKGPNGFFLKTTFSCNNTFTKMPFLLLSLFQNLPGNMVFKT